MVMTKSKWKREMAARDDKLQTTLNPKSPSFIQSKKKAIVNIAETYSGEYSCPFCLHRGKIYQFLISTKKGYHKGLGHCPECDNKMNLKTLTKDMTPEQFAQFAYEYSCQGYWQKVPFGKFNQRLIDIGWAERFWMEYKKLKGDSTPTESYSDYIDRTQVEEAKAQGLIK